MIISVFLMRPLSVLTALPSLLYIAFSFGLGRHFTYSATCLLGSIYKPGFASQLKRTASCTCKLNISVATLMCSDSESSCYLSWHHPSNSLLLVGAVTAFRG
ncbi:hypothetical protein ACQKWADRAFT_168045 [Trichoderma austrokoningii]